MNLEFRQKRDTEPRPSQLRSERPYRWSDLHKAQLHARLALDPKTRHDAFALRYKSYLAEGYIDPNPTNLFSDKHDEHPDSRTVVVYSGSEAIGSARISVMDVLSESSSTSAVPAKFVFPDEIDKVTKSITTFNRAKRAVEITRLVRHPSLARDYDLVFLLLRLVGHIITELDADVVLSCVRRNHIPFYNRLCFQTIAGPRAYPNLKFATYLLACPRSDYDNVRRIAPALNVDSSAKLEYSELFLGKSVPVSRSAVA